MARWNLFGRRSRFLRLLLLLSLAFIVISLHQRHELTSRFGQYIPDLAKDDCSSYPDLGNIAIVVKTGATEAARLIPTLLKTSLRCVKDPIIVSDLEQEISGIKLHNVLAEFAPRAMQGNVDFEIYHLQQQYQAEGREEDIPKLSSMPHANQDWRTAGKSAAWGLDKYKNIRMVELAWRTQPDREWYFFIDADTYLNWNNLLVWLSRMDHTEPLYVGQPVRMREHKPKPLDFAYGGAGILLSQAAVRTYSLERPGLTQRWDRRIQGWWFGDFMLADALDEELGLGVTDGTPMLGGESPTAMPFGPHNWCRPIVTTHHLAPADARKLLQLERTAGSELLLGRDIYHGVAQPDLPGQSNDWDNGAEDARFSIAMDAQLSETAHNSLDECEAACQSEEHCFQYLFIQQTEIMTNDAIRVESRCHLSSMFRLGQAKPIEHWNDQHKARTSFTR